MFNFSDLHVQRVSWRKIFEKWLEIFDNEILVDFERLIEIFIINEIVTTGSSLISSNSSS